MSDSGLKKKAASPQKFLSWWLNEWMSVGVIMPCFRASLRSVSDQPLPWFALSWRIIVGRNLFVAKGCFFGVKKNEKLLGESSPSRRKCPAWSEATRPDSIWTQQFSS